MHGQEGRNRNLSFFGTFCAETESTSEESNKFSKKYLSTHRCGTNPINQNYPTASLSKNFRIKPVTVYRTARYARRQTTGLRFPPRPPRSHYLPNSAKMCCAGRRGETETRASLVLSLRQKKGQVQKLTNLTSSNALRIDVALTIKLKTLPLSKNKSRRTSLRLSFLSLPCVQWKSGSAGSIGRGDCRGTPAHRRRRGGRVCSFREPLRQYRWRR